jgi:hypothetical protein
MEHISSRKGKNSIASQSACNLSNPNVHYRIHKSPPLVLVLIETSCKLAAYVEKQIF